MDAGVANASGNWGDNPLERERQNPTSKTWFCATKALKITFHNSSIFPVTFCHPRLPRPLRPRATSALSRKSRRWKSRGRRSRQRLKPLRWTSNPPQRRRPSVFRRPEGRRLMRARQRKSRKWGKLPTGWGAVGSLDHLE